jgi:hypothetical protein
LLLAPNVRLETGAVNAALLDFATGRVLSLNPLGRLIVEQIRSGIESKELSAWWASRGGEPSLLRDFVHSLCEYSVVVDHGVDDKVLETDHLTTSAIEQGLRFIWLEVTSGCNLCCLHCYTDAGVPEDTDSIALTNTRNGKRGELATEEFLGLISSAAALGC